MVGDAGEHVGRVVLWVKAVELGALDQRVDRRRSAATGIGAGEQIDGIAVSMLTYPRMATLAENLRGACASGRGTVGPPVAASTDQLHYRVNICDGRGSSVSRGADHSVR